MSSERLTLSLEARDDIARVHAELDDLDGNLPADGLGLLGEIDHAHAAFAEDADDAVGTDLCGVFGARRVAVDKAGRCQAGLRRDVCRWC